VRLIRSEDGEAALCMYIEDLLSFAVISADQLGVVISWGACDFDVEWDVRNSFDGPPEAMRSYAAFVDSLFRHGCVEH